MTIESGSHRVALARSLEGAPVQLIERFASPGEAREFGMRVPSDAALERMHSTEPVEGVTYAKPPAARFPTLYPAIADMEKYLGLSEAKLTKDTLEKTFTVSDRHLSFLDIVHGGVLTAAALNTTGAFAQQDVDEDKRPQIKEAQLHLTKNIAIKGDRLSIKAFRYENLDGGYEVAFKISKNDCAHETMNTKCDDTVAHGSMKYDISPKSPKLVKPHAGAELFDMDDFKPADPSKQSQVEEAFGIRMKVDDGDFEFAMPTKAASLKESKGGERAIDPEYFGFMADTGLAFGMNSAHEEFDPKAPIWPTGYLKLEFKKALQEGSHLVIDSFHSDKERSIRVGKTPVMSKNARATIKSADGQTIVKANGTFVKSPMAALETLKAQAKAVQKNR